MLSDIKKITYRVEWSALIDATDEHDAANQAWVLLEDAIKTNTGATVLIISDRYGENKKYIDMETVLLGEILPTCDICNEPWEDGGEGEDWNGETGNHISCEENAHH